MKNVLLCQVFGGYGDGHNLSLSMETCLMIVILENEAGSVESRIYAPEGLRNVSLDISN